MQNVNFRFRVSGPLCLSYSSIFLIDSRNVNYIALWPLLPKKEHSFGFLSQGNQEKLLDYLE